MEPDAQVAVEKLWGIVRVFLFMIKRGISKNKLILELHHLMMKRGKGVRKSIEHLVLNDHSSFSCKPHDAHLSFISPREYEFSCSNTPAYTFHSKRKHHQHRRHHHDNNEMTSVRKVFEMLNQHDATQASPLLFGKSPLVRQLRITDSPFPLGDCEVSSHVDKEAEEFIQRFHEQLRWQNMIDWEPRNQSLRSRMSNPG
ncbi:hypothetical protein ACHQM5_028699 [Ranunculus cassubicifolius]